MSTEVRRTDYRVTFGVLAGLTGVRVHGMSALAWVLWFIVCVGLALLIVNFLIDADIITTTYNIPHTNLL